MKHSLSEIRDEITKLSNRIDKYVGVGILLHAHPGCVTKSELYLYIQESGHTYFTTIEDLINYINKIQGATSH